MAFWVNNQKFLNYEEQVLKNKEDIENIKTVIGMELPYKFKVWKSGDKIFVRSRDVNTTRTFIVLRQGSSDETLTVNFRLPSGHDVYWSGTQDPAGTNLKVFSMLYYPAEINNEVNIDVGDGVLRSTVGENAEYFTLTDYMDNGVKLLEIIV